MYNLFRAVGRVEAVDKCTCFNRSWRKIYCSATSRCTPIVTTIPLIAPLLPLKTLGNDSMILCITAVYLAAEDVAFFNPDDTCGVLPAEGGEKVCVCRTTPHV